MSGLKLLDRNGIRHGAKNAFGREMIEEHLEQCLEAALCRILAHENSISEPRLVRAGKGDLSIL